jgi:hypothetical protein
MSAALRLAVRKRAGGKAEARIRTSAFNLQPSAFVREPGAVGHAEVLLFFHLVTETPQANLVCRCAVFRGGRTETVTSWFVEEGSWPRNDFAIALA